MDKKNETKEWMEFLQIKEWFPEARIKEDYNREILDIGVEIPQGEQVWILLKGEQTQHCYELISPACTWFEGLNDLAEVREVFQKACRDSSRNDE